MSTISRTGSRFPLPFIGRKVAMTLMAILSFSIPLRSYSYGDETTIANIRDHVKAGEEWSKSVRGRMVLEFDDTKDEQNERGKLARRKTDSALPREVRQGLDRRESRLSEECHRKERRQYNFDMPARRQRIEIKDLRDLQAMVAAGNLPGDKTSLANADHTAIALQDWNHFDGRLFWTQYRPRFASMSLEVLKGRERSAYDPPLSAGILPNKYLELFKKDATTIEEVNSDKKLKVKYAAKEAGSTEAILNPTDFRFQLLEDRDPQGQLYRRLQADDYHEGAGIRYPFSQTDEKWENGKNIRTTRIKVESASFGKELTAADFAVSLPNQTALIFLFGSGQTRFLLDHDTALTIDQLIQLYSELKRMADAPEVYESDDFKKLLAKIEQAGPTTKPIQ